MFKFLKKEPIKAPEIKQEEIEKEYELEQMFQISVKEIVEPNDKYAAVIVNVLNDRYPSNDPRRDMYEAVGWQLPIKDAIELRDILNRSIEAAKALESLIPKKEVKKDVQ